MCYTTVRFIYLDDVSIPLMFCLLIIKDFPSGAFHPPAPVWTGCLLGLWVERLLFQDVPFLLSFVLPSVSALMSPGLLSHFARAHFSVAFLRRVM